jgi:hypothetical protein
MVASVAWVAVALSACKPAPVPGDAPRPEPEPEPTAPATTLPPTESVPPTEYAAPEAMTGALLNEAMPNDASTVRDDLGEWSDWVEIVASGASDVSLDGWSLADGDASYLFPAGTVLHPGDHFVVWCDAQPEQGPLHAPFALDHGGDTVKLLDVNHQKVDELSWDALGEDVVWGRFPDASAALGPSIVATPGAANPVDPGMSTDASDQMFPSDRVLRFDLALSPQALASLSSDPYTPVQGSVTFEGITLEPVDINLKGQWGSLRYLPDGKSAFKVNLNAWLPGQHLRGLEKLTLNNMVQDPSCLHETFTYELARSAGAPAPRTAWAELYLNGVYRGLYLHVESPDDQFLARWFDDPNGNLYEGEYGQDVSRSYIASLDQDRQGAYDVTDRSELYALADLIAQPASEALVPELETLVDVDKTLETFAVEAAVGHWDGYFYYPNNWRIYHDPSTGKLTVLMWGTDQTFGWAGDLHIASGDIAAWMLAIPSIKVRYDLALWDASDRMAATDYLNEAASYQALFGPSFQRDDYAEVTPPTMISSGTAAVSWGLSRPSAIDSVLFP